MFIAGIWRDLLLYLSQELKRETTFFWFIGIIKEREGLVVFNTLKS